MSEINIKYLNDLNNDCLRGLEFYKEELAILQERLEEIAAGNTGEEIAEGVEHYQNQLIIHRNLIDELRHDIYSNDKNLEDQLIKTEVFVKSDDAFAHRNLHESYITEEKMFNEMRHEFYRFAARWM